MRACFSTAKILKSSELVGRRGFLKKERNIEGRKTRQV